MRRAPDPSSGALIADAIAAAPGGAIPFEHFMELALYGARGFYMSGSGAGRQRDFLTSVEVGPLFGALVARLLDREWERVGRPDPFHLVDLGAGPGTLARTVAAAEPVCAPALDVVCVEISARLRAEHPDHVRSVATFDEVVGGVVDEVAGDEAFDGVVIANELLDNVPFALAVNDGGWREAFVTVDCEASAGRLPWFTEVLSAPFRRRPPHLPDVAPHGARAPLQRRAAALVDSVLSRLRRGSLHVLDYCRPTTAELASVPWRDWLRTYRMHERGPHYLVDPGMVDITGDVAVDQLPVPDRRLDQADFLADLGIEELVEEGRRAWQRSAATPTLEALAMRSRVREAEALLDPAGLGGFCALSWWH